MNSCTGVRKVPTWAACQRWGPTSDPCSAPLQHHHAWRALQAHGRDANLDKCARGCHPAPHGRFSCQEDVRVCVLEKREKVWGVTAQVLPKSIFPPHTHTIKFSQNWREREMRSAFIMETVCVCVCVCVCVWERERVSGDFQIPAFASLHLFFEGFLNIYEEYLVLHSVYSLTY